MSHRLGLPALLGIAALTACGGPNPEAPCEEPAGEFPPTHCAYVTGRLSVAGTALTGAGVLVSDVVEPVGYAYLSAGVATADAQGRFSLLVYRMNEFRTPAVPDTATVYLKVADGPAGGPRVLTGDSVAVVMTFAPMGTPVDTTEVDLALP
jgi:hypothetical protein